MQKIINMLDLPPESKGWDEIRRKDYYQPVWLHSSPAHPACISARFVFLATNFAR